MWPPHDPFWPNFAFFSLVLTAVRLYVKFEVSSFNRSGDIRGVPKFQLWVTWPPHDPFWPNFADFGYFFQFSVCMSNLRRIVSSMTDIWLFYDFADLAAKCLFRPILGSFGGFWPPKIVKLLFWPPKVRTSRGDTRFEILCIKIGPAVFAVALFKY